jgi:hypothetical protein
VPLLLGTSSNPRTVSDVLIVRSAVLESGSCILGIAERLNVYADSQQKTPVISHLDVKDGFVGKQSLISFSNSRNTAYGITMPDSGSFNLDQLPADAGTFVLAQFSTSSCGPGCPNGFISPRQGIQRRLLLRGNSIEILEKPARVDGEQFI